MKHRIFGKKLGRNHHERQALFRSQVRSVFISGSINTTEAKAKAVTPLVEKLANVIATKSEIVARRELFRYLQDQTWVNNVYTTFKSVFGDQKSNFTKMTRIKYRYGDNALVVNLSFVKPVKFAVKKEVVKPEKTDKKETKKKPVKVAAKKEKAVKETK